jgi:hypothetical protein
MLIFKRGVVPLSIALAGITQISIGFAQTNGDQTIAPSANVSTSTNGGTNINYQTNNSFNNEFGFAPGIFCRTPSLYVGGGAGNNTSYTEDDPFSSVYQNNQSYNWQKNVNFNGQVGLVYPFGSSVIEDCKSLTRQISVDRRISTELSLIRACAALEKEGLKIDPEKYPLLAKCLNDKKNTAAEAQRGAQSTSSPNRSIKVPATTRL